MTVIEAAWDPAAKSGTIVYVMVQYLPLQLTARAWGHYHYGQVGSASPLIASAFFLPLSSVLLDSSSSLLFSLLLAQLPMLTVGSPVPHRRPSDMDKLSNQTKILIKLTQELLVSQDCIPICSCGGWFPDCLTLIELWVLVSSGGGGGGKWGERWSATW